MEDFQRKQVKFSIRNKEIRGWGLEARRHGSRTTQQQREKKRTRETRERSRKITRDKRKKEGKQNKVKQQMRTSVPMMQLFNVFFILI